MTCRRWTTARCGAAGRRTTACSARLSRSSPATRYGELLGWAFQIVDDVLDETSSAEELGKGTQKDKERGKMTYPAVIGLDASRARAREIEGRALQEVSGLDRLGHLEMLAAFVVD